MFAYALQPLPSKIPIFTSHFLAPQSVGVPVQKIFTDMVGNFSITGPFIGAPYAAMLLETLIAWGARRIIFLGWCGAVAEEVKIGDIILPTAALIDEGTSGHYSAPVNGR